MGRADFGGAQDYSQYFLQLYESYQSRVEANAQAAIREAEEEQRAADQDAMNRWQAGEMTDAEWLAYARSRLASTTDDEEMQTYWKDVLRDSQEQISVNRIEDGARDIMNRIEAGTATYADLRNFYIRERAKQKDGSQIHDQLTEQIDDVNGTIRDNATEGTIAQAEYLFKSGKISGSQAAAMIQGAAARYKTSDPARYYQLMSSAYDLRTYGAGGGGSGGGGGGRGGGGGSGGSLNSTIDELQGVEERLLSLSEQFERGADVGEITLPDGSGGLETIEVALRNPDGTPTRDMESIDAQMLETLDALEVAYTEKGDGSAAGKVGNRKQQYINVHIQPRNTIKPQQQATRLLEVGMAHIERAINSANPVAAWAEVRRWANSVSRWGDRLNKRSRLEQVGERAPDSKIRDNPELAAASRREVVTDQDAANRTTGDFVAQAQALVAFAEGVASAKSADDVQALAPLLDQMASDDGEDNPLGKAVRLNPERNVRMLDVAGAGVELVNGIAEERYVRVVDRDAGLVWAPLSTEYQTVPDLATGQPRTVPVQVPTRTDGTPLFDASRGESMTTTFMEIDGRMQQVQVVAEPIYYAPDADGAMVEITAAEYANLSEREQAKATAYRRTLVPSEKGAVTWYQDVETGSWQRDGIGVGPAVPTPFSGTAAAAQKFANENGLDPTGRAFSAGGLPAERESEARRGYSFQATLDRGTPTGRATARPQQPMNPLGSRYGGWQGDMPEQVQEIGKGLGINFAVKDSARGAAKLRGRGAKMLDMPDMRAPTRVNVRAPNIRRFSAPSVNVRPLGFDADALRARLSNLRSVNIRNIRRGVETRSFGPTLR